MGGGGLRGSMRTTLLSTLGGGRKLFLPTLSRWVTLWGGAEEGGAGARRAVRRSQAREGWQPGTSVGAAPPPAPPRALCAAALRPPAPAPSRPAPRQQLRVDGEAGVQGVGGLGHQAHRKLVLVHDDGRAEGGAGVGAGRGDAGGREGGRTREGGGVWARRHAAQPRVGCAGFHTQRAAAAGAPPLARQQPPPPRPEAAPHRWASSLKVRGEEIW